MDAGAKPSLRALLLAFAFFQTAADALGKPRPGVLRTEQISPHQRQDDAPVSLLAVQADGMQTSMTKEHSTSGHLLRTMVLDTEIHAVAYSPLGLEVATGSADNAVTVWSAGTGVALRTLYHHTGKVHSIGYSPDGEMLLTGGSDDAIIWSAEKAEMEEEFLNTGPINQVAFSRDCMYIITGSDVPVAKVWDTRTLKLKCALSGHGDKINAVAMNPEGGNAITGSHDFTAKIWDVEACIAQALDATSSTSVDAPRSTLLGHTGPVSAVAFSPYGTWVVTGSEDFTARVWEVGNGTSLSIFGVAGGGHQGAVRSVAWKPRTKGGAGGGWTPEQDLVITGSDDGTAKVWFAHTGFLKMTFIVGGKVTSVSWAPDGDKFITGSSDGNAKIWSISDSSTGTLMKGYLISPTAPAVITAR